MIKPQLDGALPDDSGAPKYLIELAQLQIAEDAARPASERIGAGGELFCVRMDQEGNTAVARVHRCPNYEQLLRTMIDAV